MALALLLITVMGLLGLSAATAVRSYALGAARQADRATLRRAALDALTDMTVRLSTDTNAWHILDDDWTAPKSTATAAPGAVAAWIEGWGHAEGFPGTRPGTPSAALRDVERRINLNTVPHPGLLRLLTSAGGLEREDAETLADALMARRAAAPHTNGNQQDFSRPSTTAYNESGGALSAIESLALLPGGADLDTARLGKISTVHGSGKVNLNTASPEVLSILLESTPEADARTVDRLLRRIQQVRRDQRVLRDLTPASIRSTFSGTGALPPDEAILLNNLLASGGVDCLSTAFEGVAVAGNDQTSMRLAFVWDRNLGQVVYWHEN